MKTTCPRVVNRWLSTEKVIKWFKIHRPQLLAHVESKQPPSAPPRLWWVSFLAMHHFTSRTTITFCTIRGLTTLLDQQQAALVGLVASLMEDVGVTGPFIAEAIANLNASSHVISDCYAVPLSSVREFISGLASWVDSIVDEANEGQQNELFNNIASIYVTACNRISELSTYRDENNNPLVDPSSFPPVLPHELIKLSAAEFIRKMRRYSYRLEQRYSSEHIDTIANKHKQLLHAYRTEQVLKQSINALSSQSAFKDGWSLLGRQFPNLMEFCGVIATLFPGTSTVESDFSILRWEKDAFRKSLSNFGLEGVLQAKQWMFIEQFEP